MYVIYIYIYIPTDAPAYHRLDAQEHGGLRRARVPLTVTSDDDVGPGHAHHSQRRAQVQLRHDAASEQEAQQHRRHLVGFVFKRYC